MNKTASQKCAVGIPTAYITVNKHRVKQYDGDIVYLDDQTEFEIELHNPTTNKVLAEIKLNGNKISNSGIVIKPGQRVFLERFIDNNNKFKFETYSVNNTKENKRAIRNNGEVEVEFYQENVSLSYNHYGSLTINGTYAPSTTIWPPKIYYTNTTDTISNFFDTTCDTAYSATYNDSKLTCSCASDITTGSVEKGSVSSQSFVSTNDRFNTFSSWAAYWKILPKENKPIEASDLIKKCNNCNTKIKSNSWKYCPSCGAEINTEPDYSKMSKEELIKLLVNR